MRGDDSWVDATREARWGSCPGSMPVLSGYSRPARPTDGLRGGPGSPLARWGDKVTIGRGGLAEGFCMGSPGRHRIL
jgi:hypothetical protein